MEKLCECAVDAPLVRRGCSVSAQWGAPWVRRGCSVKVSRHMRGCHGDTLRRHCDICVVMETCAVAVVAINMVSSFAVGSVYCENKDKQM